MASLAQYRATRGRTPVSYQEDIIRAQTPRLIGMRERELEREYNNRRLALAEQDQDLQAKAINQATTIQGLGTLVQGAGLLETVRPGTISGIGETLGLVRPGATPATAFPGTGGASGTATAAGTGASAATGAINPALASAFNTGIAPVAAGAGAFPGTAGLLSPAGLPLSASVAPPVASGAATAAGLGSTAAPAATAGTVAPTVGTTTGAAAGVGAGAASLLGPAGVGVAGGAIGSQLIGPLLPFGGRREKAAVGGALGGAGAGALAGTYAFPGVGTAVGAVVGGVVGAITGAVSVIATATFGPESAQTKLAQQFRRQKVGQLTYRGYRLWADPIAHYLTQHPDAIPEARAILVDPCIRAMAAELLGVSSGLYVWERAYLQMWLDYSSRVGRQAFRQRRHALAKGA